MSRNLGENVFGDGKSTGAMGLLSASGSDTQEAASIELFIERLRSGFVDSREKQRKVKPTIQRSQIALTCSIQCIQLCGINYFQLLSLATTNFN